MILRVWIFRIRIQAVGAPGGVGVDDINVGLMSKLLKRNKVTSRSAFIKRKPA